MPVNIINFLKHLDYYQVATIIVQLFGIWLTYRIFKAQLFLLEKQFRLTDIEIRRHKKEIRPQFEVTNFEFNSRAVGYLIDLINTSQVSSAKNLSLNNLNKSITVGFYNNDGEILKVVGKGKTAIIKYRWIHENALPDKILNVELEYYDEEDNRYIQILTGKIGRIPSITTPIEG